jgi:hypothetical protein
MNEDLKEGWDDIRPELVEPAITLRAISVDNLKAAAACYRRRKARTEHPEGAFDKNGRFYPSLVESCSCCDRVRSPSLRWPYSLMIHCRTINHIANLFGVDVKDLRREIRPCKNLPGPKDAWERLRKTG